MGKKREKKKRIKILPLILVGILLLFCINLIIENVDFGSYSETFNGLLSSRGYSSVEECVQEYIQDEINGISTKATYKSYKVLQKIDKEEKIALDLPEGLNEKQIDKVKVSYEYQGKTYTTEIYSCYLENDSYRYYVPAAKTGEPLTKSYFDSVMDPLKYINYTMNRECAAGIGFFGLKLKQSVSNTIKVADNLGYFYQGFSFLGDSSESLEAYIKDSSSGLKTVGRQIIDLDVEFIMSFVRWLDNIFNFIEDDSFWEEYDEAVANGNVNEMVKEELGLDTGWQIVDLRTTLGLLTSLSDLARIGFPGNIDHTFFIKTNNGFTVNPEKQEDFTKAMLIGAAAVQGETPDFAKELYEWGKWEFDGTYYVSEGRLIKSVLKRTGNFENLDAREVFGSSTPDIIVELFKNYCMDSSETTYFIDFGTTQITFPEEVQSYFE